MPIRPERALVLRLNGFASDAPATLERMRVPFDFVYMNKPEAVLELRAHFSSKKYDCILIEASNIADLFAALSEMRNAGSNGARLFVVFESRVSIDYKKAMFCNGINSIFEGSIAAREFAPHLLQ